MDTAYAFNLQLANIVLVDKDLRSENYAISCRTISYQGG